MRAPLLNPLFATLASLPGIGEKRAQLFERLLAPKNPPARVIDLLFHLPTNLIDRRARPKIRDVMTQRLVGTVVTLEVKATLHSPPTSRFGKAPYKILVEDDTGDVTLVFFHGKPEWLRANLPLGETRWVSGTINQYDGFLQMEHPKVLDAAALAKMSPLEPVYPLTEGLFQGNIQQAMGKALARVPELPEWRAGSVTLPSLNALPTFTTALQAIHLPQTPEALLPSAPARLRLAFDELFAHQLALNLVRKTMRQDHGITRKANGVLAQKILTALPFTLTNAQQQAISEICNDLESPKRMVRLLQGDVGSGKTLVTLMAIAHVIEAGFQAALMAPTEILARQHFKKLAPLCVQAGITLGLLTGRDSARERAATLAALEDGSLQAVIGTHALFQDAVRFQNLGLAVVDEQHRFGVHQRLMLANKGASVDLLVTTATPIPRTLVLSYFGDMEVSNLREKPAGRQAIDTRVKPLAQLDEVVAGLHRALQNGAQIYWVCPLVEESELVDAAAAVERHDSLVQIFGADIVGIIHGRLKSDEKDAAMQKFAQGQTRILVATTAIEVGVDVPNATIMVIEHAERFGLAQLHQLRGRVGRGSKASSCLLLYKAPLSDNAKARLAMMRQTNDGFLIAEEDLRLRGAGEVLGTRQSGEAGFRLADLSEHAGLLSAARDMAREVLAREGEMSADERAALQILLSLFGHDEAMGLLMAG